MIGLTVLVYLSGVGVGFSVLPVQAVQALVAQNPVRALGAVDGGATAQGYYLKAALASPSVVNLGALNVSWQGGRDGGNWLGVKLGQLNTTVPITCPPEGASGVALQLDAQLGDNAAQLSRIAYNSSTVAARIEWSCRSAGGLP